MHHRRHALQALVPTSASAPSAGRVRLRATKSVCECGEAGSRLRKKLRQAGGTQEWGG